MHERIRWINYICMKFEEKESTWQSWTIRWGAQRRVINFSWRLQSKRRNALCSFQVSIAQSVFEKQTIKAGKAKVLPSMTFLLISLVTVSSDMVFLSCPSAFTSVLFTCSVNDSVLVSAGWGIAFYFWFATLLLVSDDLPRSQWPLAGTHSRILCCRQLLSESLPSMVEVRAAC